MHTPAQLLQAYLSNVREPAIAAALFAEDGIIELPAIHAKAQGPKAIEAFLGSLLNRVPDFRFQDVHIFIDTPDQAFGEYSVEATVTATGKLYRQTYAGRLVAKQGKITLLREALDTLAAHRAFNSDV